MIQRCFLVFSFIIFLSACANSPQTVSAQEARTMQLTNQLRALSPDVTVREAKQFAEVAVRTATQLREQYQVTLTPWLHNVEVNWGMKKRGYCYHYASDLNKALKKVPAPHLQLYFIKANPGEMLEHNALSVTAKGKPWDTGILLDAWRNAGVLYFGPVKEDKYPWQLSRKKAI